MKVKAVLDSSPLESWKWAGLIFCSGTLFAFLIGLDQYFLGSAVAGSDAKRILLENLLVIYILLAFCPAILLITKKLPLSGESILLPLFIHLLTGATFAFFHLLINDSILLWIQDEKVRFDYSCVSGNGSRILFRMMLYLQASGIFYAVNYFRKKQDAALRANELELSFTKRQRARLNNQLNPRFLLRILDSLRDMVRHNAGKAISTIQLFADYLRLTLAHSRLLQDQVERLGCYLRIQQCLLGTGFRFHIELDPILRDVSAERPDLFLAVEQHIQNRFRNGEDYLLQIQLRKSGNSVLIEISDTKSLPSNRTPGWIDDLKGALEQPGNEYLFSWDESASGLVQRISLPLSQENDEYEEEESDDNSVNQSIRRILNSRIGPETRLTGFRWIIVVLSWTLVGFYFSGWQSTPESGWNPAHFGIQSLFWLAWISPALYG